MAALTLWQDTALVPASVLLAEHHYLGPLARAALGHQDSDGVLTFANPSSRHLPKAWLELTRWCITGPRNAGSQQWKRAVAWLRVRAPSVTTVVSYSDPAVGHTGALYRACNWLWAPTWLRLREPPSANGAWNTGDAPSSVKDRWVYLLKPDAARESCLALKDPTVLRRMAWASYREPSWRHGKPQQGGGGDWQRWRREVTA